MRIENPPNHKVKDEPKMRLMLAVIATASSLLMTASVASAQSRPAAAPPQTTVTQPQTVKPSVITLRLGPDQIGTLKTGEKLSTRVSFQELVKEVICGDLYDSTSGTGSFVIQRIDRDVFVKPVALKGISNMFVKTGDGGEHIYNFSLLIVPSEQAYLIVKVIDAPESASVLKGTHTKYRPLPVAAKIDTSDIVTKNTGGIFADALTVKPWGNAGIVETPPPPPKAVPKTSSSGQREPIKRVKADYPVGARIARATGDVIVEVTIDKKGAVSSARAISGHPLLIGTAIKASRSWKFNPVSDGDQQALSLFRITYRFRDYAEVKQ